MTQSDIGLRNKGRFNTTILDDSLGGFREAFNDTKVPIKEVLRLIGLSELNTIPFCKMRDPSFGHNRIVFVP